MSSFQAHFGWKLNTPLSIISTEPNLNKLSYQITINKNLDQETVQWTLISEDKWERRACSDAEVESKNNSNETHLIKTEGLARRISKTEESLQLNLAALPLSPQSRRNQAHLKEFKLSQSKIRPLLRILKW